jgi:hypothetical protein
MGVRLEKEISVGAFFQALRYSTPLLILPILIAANKNSEKKSEKRFASKTSTSTRSDDDARIF